MKEYIKITKNRNREKPDFANINLLGQCNVNCYFCLGKDIQKELSGKNQLTTHFSQWKNFELFLNDCKENGIKKLYMTGQTADGLQYKYLEEIVDYLQDQGFIVGVRTNGMLAKKKIDIINKMKSGIGYSIHTINPETNKKIMGTDKIPDWEYLLNNSGDNVRVSIVLNKHNKDEFYELLDYLSGFDKINYIQVRRISTDTRYDLLKEDVTLYEDVFNEFKQKFNQFGQFYNAEQYNYKGKEVDFWRTVETSINSFNYFTDGVISKEYFIVEGYLNNLKKFN